MNNKLLIALISAASSLALASSPAISPFFTFQTTPFGAGPNGPLLLASDGNFYGTTSAGGDDGHGCFTVQFVCAGTVFKITPQGQLTLLHTFSDTDPANGELPLAGLVEGPDGFLYGTTNNHGFNLFAGTIFKIDKNGGNFQTLYQFCSASGCPVGSAPAAALILASDGNFYGTTTSGPNLATGAIFRMTPAGVVSLIAVFDGHNNVAGIPGFSTSVQLMQASDVYLYGLTEQNIFRLTLDGAFTILHTFDPASEGSGSASLVQANDGNLYGMTDTPSVFVGGGVLFRIGTDGTYQKLSALNASAIGFHPQTLIQASDGNLWGITTNTTSANSGGAVYSVTLSGAFLQSTFLTRATGLGPTGALTQGRDGRLFGAAALGGVNAMGNTIDAGTIFVVDAGLPPLLQSIQIGAPNTSLASGASEQFTATGTYGDGSKQNITNLVTWSSSNTSAAVIGAATGLASGVAAGSTNISASLAGVTSNQFSLTIVGPAAPVITAFRVLFGAQSYLITGTSRIRLPWQVKGIQVEFSQPITSGSAASLGGIAATGFNGLGTNTLTWSFAPLSVANVSVTLAGSGMNALTNSGGVGLGGGAGASQSLKILWGDFTDDSAVSATDLVGVNNARVSTYNIFADVNGDGIVDATDVQIVRSQIGTILP
jgi:hypothetical protein